MKQTTSSKATLIRYCWRKLCHFLPTLPHFCTCTVQPFGSTKWMTIAYSCSSVISFSFASTSSLRLLICFWCVSRWLWICCSTACYYKKQKHVLYTFRSCYTSFCLKKKKDYINLPWLHLQSEPYLSALSPSHGLFLIGTGEKKQEAKHLQWRSK